MSMNRTEWITCLATILALAVVGAEAEDDLWLDRPLAGWNTPGADLPPASITSDTRATLMERCSLVPHRTTAAEQALYAAGWVPQWHFDRQALRGDVEIVAGVSTATENCEPSELNLFVFVDGDFAGTLSPGAMHFRRDGAIGAVRIVGGDNVTVEFARYASTDTECCPSSRVRVTFKVDRSGAQPVIVPVSARQVRGQ